MCCKPTGIQLINLGSKKLWRNQSTRGDFWLKNADAFEELDPGVNLY